MLTGRHFALLALTLFFTQGIQAGEVGTKTITEAQKKEAAFLDTLSVPSSGEVFAALNKTCHPNWVALVSPTAPPVTTDRQQLALTVGVLAANGYIAVEAQDGQQVKNVGRDMMSVAKALGVSENLMGRGNSLMEFAKNSAWDSLAAELEVTENEVKAGMIEQKDRHLVLLASAAAWLRGIEVATRIVLEDPDLNGAEVVRQPGLARQLAAQLQTLPERSKKSVLVTALQHFFEQSATLTEGMGENPKSIRAALQQLHDEAAALIKEILASDNAAEEKAAVEKAAVEKGTGGTVKP